MRKIVQRLQRELNEFVVQRDDLVLVVRCSDPDSALVSKMVEGMDESRESELYWYVIDEFVSEASFAEECVQSFAVKHEAARLVLEQKGEPPLPPLPAEIAAAGGLPPAERVRQLMLFSRSLLPKLSGCGVVWAFLPARIDDPAGYAAFVSAVWQHEFPFPWCHHVRLVVRDAFPTSILQSRTDGAPRLRVTSFDMSPPAIEEALRSEAGDDAAPLEQRINNTLMLAGIDYGHDRFDRAMQQYDVVHRYASATGNPTLAAIALNGLGEVHRRQGQLDQAGRFFENAIAPAAQAEPPPVPVLFNLYLNLGEVRYTEQRWEDAEVFLQGAADFAMLMRDPDQRLRCWSFLAAAQAMQGKSEDAIETWTNGAVVAHVLDKQQQYGDFVTALRSHFGGTGDQVGLQRAMQRMGDLITEAQREQAELEAGATAGNGSGLPG